MTQQLQNLLIKNNIKMFFLKKLKCLNYLKFITTLSNTVMIFCCENLPSIDFFTAIESNILFAKIDSTYYSLNSFSKYLEQGTYKICLSTFLYYYYTNISLLLDGLKTKKN